MDCDTSSKSKSSVSSCLDAMDSLVLSQCGSKVCQTFSKVLFSADRCPKIRCFNRLVRCSKNNCNAVWLEMCPQPLRIRFLRSYEYRPRSSISSSKLLSNKSTSECLMTYCTLAQPRPKSVNIATLIFPSLTTKLQGSLASRYFGIAMTYKSTIRVLALGGIIWTSSSGKRNRLPL